MTEAKADQKIETELDKIWPEWRGVPGSVGQVKIRLVARDKVFDYSLDNVGQRLSLVKQAVHKAHGDNAGLCVSLRRLSPHRNLTRLICLASSTNSNGDVNWQLHRPSFVSISPRTKQKIVKRWKRY